MPNRILKENICSSDDINELSWFEEVLFYRLIVSCDDYGRYDGRPAIIKNRLFPLKDNLTSKSVSAALNKLASVGLVAMYEFDGKPYLHLPTWEKHQTPRAKKSKYPDPENGSQTSANICKQMQADECNGNQVNADVHDIRYSINDIRYSGNEESDEIITAWNGLGLSQVTRIMPNSQRYTMLNARIREYGKDEILKAIENIKGSSFLRGQNQRNWVITFDWFLKPNNFVKVRDGNYTDAKPEPRGKNYYGDHSHPDERTLAAMRQLMEEEAQYEEEGA